MQALRPRVARRAVHGVLLLDKPLGLSSNDALQKAKRLYRAEKAGHTGTLDPLATGLLPLCFGAATKFSQVSLDADKRYLATLKLGISTSTADAEGEVLQRRTVTVSTAQMQAACERFSGEIDQIPPMHSALKRDGKPLYEYARAGVDVERAARRVTIHRIAVVSGQGDEWTLDVRCSKGTYIRTLAEDIGEALGTGAHLAALRRTASGPFRVEDAVPLDRLAAPPRGDHLLSLPALLQGLPRAELDAAQESRFRNGQSLDSFPGEGLRAVYGADGRVIGLGEAGPRGALRPLRLLAQAADKHPKTL